jgi:RNA polymerase sigma factor (sigma-70 family)
VTADGPGPENAGARESELVERAIAGEELAFTALYDRHLDRVYRHVFYRVGNHSDAEDLTQQVFLKAWQAIGRYRRTEAPFIAWLLTIAHNLVVSFYRRGKVAPLLDLDPASTARWSDPVVQVLDKFDRVAVRDAILQLKPEQQLVITMRFMEQFDNATVAAVLGKSEVNVRVIQYRALRDLRKLLAREEER